MLQITGSSDNLQFKMDETSLSYRPQRGEVPATNTECPLRHQG